MMRAAVTAVVGAAYAGYVARIGRAPAPMGADYESLIAAGEVWVGDSGGSVVGVLVIRPSDEILELENVAVDPAEQGHGYGRALIAFAESRARELGLTAVELYTNEAMVENLRLYPRLGFVETGRRRRGRLSARLLQKDPGRWAFTALASFARMRRLRHGLSGFIIRRLLLGLVTLWITSVVIFAATQALPGDAARSILGRSATPESLADLRSSSGSTSRSSPSTGTGSAASSPAISERRSRTASRSRT